jgi:hypothetical protein
MTGNGTARLAPEGRRLDVRIEDTREGDRGVHFSIGLGLKWTPLAQARGPDAAIGADCRHLYGKAELMLVERQVRA